MIAVAGLFFSPLRGSCESGTVRLAMVVVPDDLLRPLLPDFQRETGLRADIVYTGEDPYAVAREGRQIWSFRTTGTRASSRLSLKGWGYGRTPFLRTRWCCWGLRAIRPMSVASATRQKHFAVSQRASPLSCQTTVRARGTSRRSYGRVPMFFKRELVS